MGSIYQDALDAVAVEEWKQVIRVPECQTCLCFPLCVRLKKCPWHEEGCTEEIRLSIRDNLAQRALGTYRSTVEGNEESLR